MARSERVIVHFGTEGVTDVPIEQLAADAGTTVAAVRANLREAVEAGFLTPRPDGGYDATLPQEATP